MDDAEQAVRDGFLTSTEAFNGVCDELSDAKFDLAEALDKLAQLRSENAELCRDLSAAISREQAFMCLLGMAEGVIAKADEVIAAHHAGECTPALVARAEVAIQRFRLVKAKDLPPPVGGVA